MAHKHFLHRELFMALNKSVFIMEKSIEHVLRVDGRLTLSQFDVLLRVSVLKTVSQQVISEITHKTQASVSRQVALLLRKKLITKVQNSKNRREYVLTCTPLGETYVKKVMEVLDAHFARVLVDFSVEDIRSMVSFGDLLIKAHVAHGVLDSATLLKLRACDTKVKKNIKNL